MSQVFVPHGVNFHSVGIAGLRPSIVFRDPLCTKDDMITFESRAAMLRLVWAILNELQDYDTTKAESDPRAAAAGMGGEFLPHEGGKEVKS